MAYSVYGVDIGAIQTDHLGWSRIVFPGNETGKQGNLLSTLCQAVIADLENGNKIALGFDAPLYIPIPDKETELTRSREFEGEHSWSTGAGAAVLSTGLVQISWLFMELSLYLIEQEIKVTFDIGEWKTKPNRLMIWEAFITGISEENEPKKRKSDHIGDARSAAEWFIRSMLDRESKPSDEYGWVNRSDWENRGRMKYLSLIGMTLIRSSVLCEKELIGIPCVVIKAPKQ